MPEAAEGARADFREVAVAAEGLGRSLLPTPWFGTAVLAVGALLLAGERTTSWRAWRPTGAPAPSPTSRPTGAG